MGIARRDEFAYRRRTKSITRRSSTCAATLCATDAAQDNASTDGAEGGEDGAADDDADADDDDEDVDEDDEDDIMSRREDCASRCGDNTNTWPATVSSIVLPAAEVLDLLLVLDLISSTKAAGFRYTGSDSNRASATPMSLPLP